MLVCNNVQETFVSYQWYKNGEPVTTTQEYREPAGLSGIYYLEAVTVEGITVTSDEMVFTGQNATLTLYPNPANTGDNVHVKVSGLPVENAQIAVYNMSGQCMANMEYHVEPIRINTANMLSGTYIVRYLDGNNIIKSVSLIIK